MPIKVYEYYNANVFICFLNSVPPDDPVLSASCYEFIWLWIPVEPGWGRAPNIAEVRPSPSLTFKCIPKQPARRKTNIKLSEDDPNHENSIVYCGYAHIRLCGMLLDDLGRSGIPCRMILTNLCPDRQYQTSQTQHDEHSSEFIVLAMVLRNPLVVKCLPRTSLYLIFAISKPNGSLFICRGSTIWTMRKSEIMKVWTCKRSWKLESY